MHCRNIRLLLFGLIALGSCLAQRDPDRTSILDRPESYQRQFIVDFLDFIKDSATGFVKGYPQTSIHSDDFELLVRFRSWVIPLAETRVNQWLDSTQSNKPALDRVLGIVAEAGTIEAVEFLGRVVSKQPEFKPLLRLSITSKFGQGEPNFITKYYHALESENPLIREVAAEAIPERLKDPTESTIYVWGEALLEKRRREPTTLELLNDPLIKMAPVNSELNPEEFRQKLARSTREGYTRRQIEGPRKTK